MENLILRRKKRYRHIHIANPSSPPVRTSDHRNLIMKNPTQTHLQSKKTKNVGTLGDGNTPNFPPEIIEEILKRLPVESLLKFRCVSKLWRSLISSPEFIKIHLNFSTSNPSFTNHRIISNILDTDLDPKLSLVNPLLPEHETEIDYPMKGLDRIVWVVGSCNGLVCLALDDSNICLWNPTMRTSKKLPPLSVVMKKSFHYLWSFGFDECDDDYKVVGIRSSGRLNSKVMIYSLKADSWKRIKNFKSGIPSKDSGKYASGKLHFAAKDRDSGWNIVSLDLSSEVYGMVEQPNYGSGSNDSTLGVLGGCVCVLRNYVDIRGDVWVLKEYNVKESWTKLISIPYNGRVKYLLTTPLIVLPNGEVLLDYERHFEVYNPKDNSFRISEATNVNGFITADIYVESLVSL